MTAFIKADEYYFRLKSSAIYTPKNTTKNKREKIDANTYYTL